MKNRLLVALICVAPALFIAPEAEAWSPKISVDDDQWIQLGFLGQFRAESHQDLGGGEQDRWTAEFYTRRARIMALGSVHPNVRFFLATDVPNTGREGIPNSIIWNDGFVDFQFLPELKLSFGRILVPFSIENRASAAALLGIDYNLSLLKIPTFIDRAFWRDDGVEARGILFDGYIDYRVALFRGVRDTSINPSYLPRVTGMVVVNLQDAQPGWFYNPNSLGSLDVISFGAGVDHIFRTARGGINATAWNLFALVEQDVGGGRLNAMAGFYNWDGPGWGGGFEGATMGLQLGYLVPGEILPDTPVAGKIQPVLRFQRQDDLEEDGFELNTINLGLNYYLKGQNANLKVDFAINDRFDADDEQGKAALRFQAQLLF